MTGIRSFTNIADKSFEILRMLPSKDPIKVVVSGKGYDGQVGWDFSLSLIFER